MDLTDVGALLGPVPEHHATKGTLQWEGLRADQLMSQRQLFCAEGLGTLPALVREVGELRVMLFGMLPEI